MKFVEEIFNGMVAVHRPTKSDKEVLLSIRSGILQDQKLPFETGISDAFADAVRLIDSLYEDNQRLRELLLTGK